MSEVFIIHDVEDQARAGLLGAALGARGVRVWDDFGFAPERARASLVRAAIERSAAAIVIWSPRAVVSDAIVDAAGHGAAQGKLSAVAFEAVRPPPAFMGWTMVDLSAWGGRPDEAAIDAIMTQIEARCAAFLPTDEGTRRARDRKLGEDVRDVRKALQKSGEAGWRDYLRRRPDGIFAVVAGEQLRQPPAYVSPAELEEVETDKEDHWRYERGSFGARVKTWIAAPGVRLGGALAALAFGALVGVQYLRPPPADGTATLAAPTPLPQIEASAPPGAIEAHAPEAALDEAETRARAFASLPSAPRTRAPNAPPSAGQALSLPATPPTPAAPTMGAAEAAAPAPAPSARAGDPPLTGAPFDRLALDRDTRWAVEQARRAQLRALARAEAEPAQIEPAAFNGALYQGEPQNGRAQARGLASFASGARYAGQWRNGAPDGWGVLTYADGVRYEGEFAAGRPTGRGALWSARGARIVGEAQFARLLRRVT
jgi:hypothetical protein